MEGYKKWNLTGYYYINRLEINHFPGQTYLSLPFVSLPCPLNEKLRLTDHNAGRYTGAENSPTPA